MAYSKLTEYDLEPRAIKLRSKIPIPSFAKIAKILSSESGEEISASAVQRFFAKREDAHEAVIMRSDKLKSKLIDAEINTVEKRQKIITLLEGVAVRAINEGDYRAAVDALREATNSLNSLDTRLGKYTAAATVNVNTGDTSGVVVYIPDNSRDPQPETIEAEYDET